MTTGYACKILRVDLTAGKIVSEDMDRQARRFIGGAGLAAKILWDETSAATRPLSPENPLVFMIGPLTGTVVPGASRHAIAAVSPLTGIWGQAHAGGRWGHALGHTPYNGIVVTGKAKRPVYLWINNGEAELRDAGHLWGKDTWETSDLLKKETDDRASVAAIGQAGENLVKIAGVMSDGRMTRAAARCGLGAVMGSKMLKAVVVRGTDSPRVHDESQLKESVNRYSPRLKPFDRDHLKKTMTERLVGRLSSMGCIKNWSAGEIEGFEEPLAAMWREGDPAHCIGCRVGCQPGGMSSHGQRHIHGEIMYPFGSNCLITDMGALYHANEMCNKYGLDTISTGQVIAFGMELFEKGLITTSDTGGIELKWGNAAAMLQVLDRIANNQGIGELLGEGVREAAHRIGGRAEEYAIHVKGLEFPWIDPRPNNFMALRYAIGNRGADHLDGHGGFLSNATILNEEDAKVAENLLSLEGVGRITARYQDFDALLDSLMYCKLVVRSTGWIRETTEPVMGVHPEKLLEWLNLVTDWGLDIDEFWRTGERIFNLKRAFNVRRGISRKDDFLPLRVLTRKRGGEGPGATSLPHLGEMLNEYYRCRAWSEEGIPTGEKLAELGLTDV